MLRPSSGLAGILLTSGQPLAIRRYQIAGTDGPRAHISVDVVAKSRCPLFASTRRTSFRAAKNGFTQSLPSEKLAESLDWSFRMHGQEAESRLSTTPQIAPEDLAVVHEIP